MKELAIVKVCEELDAFKESGLNPNEVAKLVKDKQEGRLIELPCIVGQIVYMIFDTKDEPGKFVSKQSVEYIKIFRSVKNEIIVSFKTVSDFWFDIDDFGKTVFPTQEEAEDKIINDNRDKD